MFSVKITNLPRDVLDNRVLYDYMNYLFPGHIFQVLSS
mgnify:CR=1 FL=1